MAFSDWMADDIGDLFEDAGDTVTYIAQGQEREIVAIAEIGTNETTRNAHDKDRSYENATFTVLDDADKGITDPQAGDEIIYKGTRYTYVSIEQHNPGAVWRLRFVMHESAMKYGSMW